MNLPSHLFVDATGSLSDTRKPGWAVRPLRPLYSRHLRTIRSGADVRACLRAGEYSWPGGYACYFLTSDGAALSFEAVRKHLRSVTWSIRNQCNDGWRVIGMECTANCDETPICDHTGKEIS
jgi:hypothetical protein